MKTIESVIASSRIDSHGDVITEGALRDMADQMARYYIPMQFNHDPRIPPLGRTIDAYVREADDGAYELVGITELFEPEAEPPLESDGKRMRIGEFDPDSIVLMMDRSYAASDDFAELDELSKVLGADLRTYEKKALEPLSVLLLTVAAGSTAFAAGFLNKMGGDTWDAVKPRLARLLGRRRQVEEEYLFILELQLQSDGRPLSVQCILTNPSNADLETFWDIGIEGLKQQLPDLLALDPELVRVVLHYQDQSLVPAFAVRSDGVPFALEIGPAETLDRDDV